MFFFLLFLSKVSYLLSEVKITINFYIFFVFKGFFCFVLHPNIFFRCFSLFCLPWPPASQFFNLLLSFSYFDPVIILIKKNCAFAILRYGLGPKQPILVILSIYISRLGNKICPNELILHAHTKKKFTIIFCF